MVFATFEISEANLKHKTNLQENENKICFSKHHMHSAYTSSQ